MAKAAPRPSKTAVAALKKDPSLAADFDAKLGPGAGSPHLHGTVEVAALLDQTKANNALIDEMLAGIDAPKRVVRDRDGDIIGVEVVDDDELEEFAEVRFVAAGRHPGRRAWQHATRGCQAGWGPSPRLGSRPDVGVALFLQFHQPHHTRRDDFGLAD
jgi:hypothetical protein